MKKLDVIAVILLIVGGLNWGLVGLFHFDLVAAIFGMKFGQTSWLSSAVYVLVALSALIKAVGLTSGHLWPFNADFSPVPLKRTRIFPKYLFNHEDRRQADDNASHPYRSTRYSGNRRLSRLVRDSGHRS